MCTVRYLSLLLVLTTWNTAAYAAEALSDAIAPSGVVDRPNASVSAGDLNLTSAKATLPGFTIRRTVPEVRLQFTVADAQGRLLKSISSADLHILDNRVAVPRIRDFSRTEDLPLQVGILLDISDSVEKTALRERHATQFFLTHVVRPETDRVALMAFSNRVEVWQRSTGDRDALKRALANISQRGYITNLYDSVYHACLEQFSPSQHGDSAQRILVLISDGEDTGSLHTMADAISAAQRREVQVYALSVHKARQSPPGDSALKRLAESTGGQLYVAASEKDFPGLFAAMEQQMRSQYAVSFQPVDKSPGFHTVQIEMAGGPKFRIHARNGYFLDTQ